MFAPSWHAESLESLTPAAVSGFFAFSGGDRLDYKSKRWERLRERVLRRDGYKCRESARYKAIPDEATTVHHVWPAEDFPEWAWCEWNLIAVSQKAHDSLHDRRSGKLTEKGLAWQRRVIPPPQIGDE